MHNATNGRKTDGVRNCTGSGTPAVARPRRHEQTSENDARCLGVPLLRLGAL